MDEPTRFDAALAELESAEDFLTHFGIAFDPQIVQVNRLHILQRFHDYLAKEADACASGDDATRAAIHRGCLQQAYDDFVRSDALTEKVFRVFHTAPLPDGGQSTFVPIDKVFK